MASSSITPRPSSGRPRSTSRPQRTTSSPSATPPPSGDAIHAGISAKDAIVTALTGATRKGKDHAAAAKELKTALGARADAPTAEKALRELIGAKGDVEYGTTLLTATKAEPLVRRARLLVDIAVQIVRLGG